MSRRSTFLEGIRSGADPVFSLNQRSLSRAGLWSRACGYANFLVQQGIQPGDCVGVHLSDGLHVAIALVGHYILGVVHAPINPRSTAAEIEHFITEGQLVGLVSDGEPVSATGAPVWSYDFAKEASREPSPREDEDVALLLFTSGTTGKSKAVELSYRAVLSNIDALTTLWRWTPDDVLVLSLPLFHVHGLGIGIHGVLLRGCQAQIQDGFDPASVIEAFKSGATIFMGVPTMYSRLVAHLENDPDGAVALSRGRLFTSGSAALGVQVLDRFIELTGHTILERYGMSETMLTLSNPYEDRRRGSVGGPVKGVEVQIVGEGGRLCLDGEAGELWVRGASLMNGYRGRLDDTAAAFTDGWFRTGDIVVREDGYISILGRDSTDIIKSGGFKIGAREIEEILLKDADVLEVAVLGVPDDDLGEKVVAALVLVEGADHSDLLARLQRLSREHLSAYKTLREVKVLPELPRNPMGKLQKFRLREHFSK